MGMQTNSICVLLLVLVIVCLAFAHGMELYDNKEVAEKRPFFVGSRYGRSSSIPSGNRQMVARNDRFFVGSRYGKRSSDKFEDGFPAIKISTPEVTCLYTGVLNLYKCFG